MNLFSFKCPCNVTAVRLEGSIWADTDFDFPYCYVDSCLLNFSYYKTANVLNKLPKMVQPKVKQVLHEIWMAPTKEDAYKAFGIAVSTFSGKYPKAMDCLEKDKSEMLAFYDFTAAHWQHIRISNPIESTFATVRLRTVKTRGCVARHTILSMVYKLGQSAQKRWRKLRGFKQLAEVIRGGQFKDGERAQQGCCLSMISSNTRIDYNSMKNVICSY